MNLSYGDETAFTVTPNVTASLRCIFKKWSVRGICKSIWTSCAVVLFYAYIIFQTFGVCMVLAYNKTSKHVTKEIKLL